MSQNKKTNTPITVKKDHGGYKANRSVNPQKILIPKSGTALVLPAKHSSQSGGNTQTSKQS